MQDSNFHYSDALRKLNQISLHGAKPGLERIRKLLAKLGNPQSNFKSILIGGTNGKGSTTYFLSNILTSCSKKCGTFISPPIFSFRERIQIDGKWISTKDFVSIFSVVDNAASELEDKPSFFEILTAMAILYFSEKKVEYAVLEVGMGGRLDATNIIDAQLSIITSIALEHIVYLGNSYNEIASEKAGIIKKNKPIIFAVDDKDAKSEIIRIAKDRSAKLIDATNFFKLISLVDGRAKFSINLGDSSIILRLASPGIFQLRNAVCALLASHELALDSRTALNSITTTIVNGRWQTISTNPQIIIDAAHNLHAINAIKKSLDYVFTNSTNNKILIFCAMKDKDYSSMLENLIPFFDKIVFCSSKNSRGESASNLAKCARKINPKKEYITIDNSFNALIKAKELVGSDGKILITGSIYLLQEIVGDDELSFNG